MHASLPTIFAVAFAWMQVSAAPTQSSEIPQYDLKIERQPLSRALQEFAKQSGIQIIFFSKLTDGYEAPSTHGRFTAAAAMARLLESSELTYRELNEKTIQVQSKNAISSTKADSYDQRVASGALSGLEGNEASASNGASNPDSLRLAQAAEGSTDPAQEPDQNAKKKQAEIETIIVTATKRGEERLQDVPMSITAIGADEIDRRGLVNAEDYLRGIPGVNQLEGQSGIGQTIIIRGMETSPANQSFSAGVTTATYFGETPTSTSAGLSGGTSVDQKLVDIERVEVLRGPQGTAFGSSSLGGAVRVIPEAPNLERLEAKVGAGFSATSGTGDDNYNVQGVANLPLVQDKLAIRAVAYQQEDSGFYRNRAGSDAAFQAAVVPFGMQSFAVDDDEVGTSLVRGGRIAARLRATDDFRLTLSYLSQKTEVDGTPGANSGTYEQTLLQIAPEHVVRGQNGGFFDTDIGIANVIMEYNLGWGQLVGTYSDVNSTTQVGLAGAFGSTFPISYGGPSDHRAHVGEVRLATQLDGAWQFLAGLYLEDLKDNGLFEYRFLGVPGPGGVAGDYLDRRDLRQRAAFGEVSWEFLPKLTLTGGVRVYEYDWDIQIDTGGFFGDRSELFSTDTSGSIFRGNLSYKLNDRGMIYAGWSEGFRLGKPQPGLATVCDLDSDGIVDGTSITLASTRTLDSDEVENYELGGKFTLLDRRLRIDATVFQMDWTNIPVEVVAPVCSLGYLTNAGAARSKGVELQLNYRLAAPFQIDLGGSWIDAEITKDVPRQGFFAGDPLPGSPEINANLGLQYDFELGGNGGSIRTDAIYVDSFYGDILQSPTTKSGNYVKFDVSARLSIRNLNVDIFARNITNEDAFSFRGGFPGPNEFSGYRLRPRTIGLQLGYKF